MGKYYIKYGVGIGIALIAYFLLTKLLGWHEYPILSAFNGIIFGVGIFLALKTFKQDAYDFKYHEGFQLGLFVGGLATILFSSFMALYIFQVDTEFAAAVLDSWDINFNKGSLILVIMLFIMGFSTSFVLTLAFMQLLKQSWNTSKSL